MPYLRPRWFGSAAGLALLLGCTGCAGLDDPFRRAGTWQAEYVNDTNLAAMATNPAHLQQGVGDPASPGELSAAAVHRLLTDRVKKLPVTDISPVAAGAGQSQGSSSAGTGAR
ncbi:conserved exported protein of unknown function [Rhodovastum atsumiense]|uniref:DUF3035 domain-containing protein n=1 Tax=Rhodovastum atsumiense TaxID=504468 RepID=A0A5M6J2Q0_9PROT|nr:hypothetical protein [Rhodovastum atsumiense]KAA5613895.1 hypothetical protein F1189_03730 [Rhodovastum atsumiense]CAH2602021.1 conserved exported protein of unknown function [Rhodovastum atsumiense]